MRCKNGKLTVWKKQKSRNTKQAHILCHGCIYIFELKIDQYIIQEVNSVLSYSKTKVIQNWLRKMSACINVPLNEILHRKFGHIDLELVQSET